MSTSLSAQHLPAYTVLAANDGRRVILPVGAAGRSRLLHDLLEGLHVMQIAVSAKAAAGGGSGSDGLPLSGSPAGASTTAASASASASASAAGVGDKEEESSRYDLYTEYVAQEARQQPRSNTGSESFAGGGEEAFVCYARAYPAFPSAGSAATADTADHRPLRMTEELSSPLLEVPLTCVEGETLARIAQFLVLKACRAAQPSGSGGGGGDGFVDKTDPLKDLNCTSQKDQLTAIRLLLGSDLLGC